jgi:glycosyltransferase involved in cell wall biosynthesis
MKNPTIEEYIKKQLRSPRKQGGLKVNNSFHETSQQNQPLITIITVTYNAADSLEVTIQSVLNQTYHNLEYIIIDGGSTDSTIDIIKKYETHIAYWCSEPDKGIYDAMNKGIALSEGALIGLINAGDTYLPNALFSITEKYISSDKLFIYYGDIYRWYTDANIKIKVNSSFEELKYSMSICHQAMFITKYTYLTHGLYNLNYKYVSDYAYILSLLQANANFIYVDSIIACYQTGGVTDEKMLESRIESIRVHFDSKSKYWHHAVIKYLKQLLRYYFYQIVIVSLLGKTKAAKIRRERLAAKFPNHDIFL